MSKHDGRCGRPFRGWQGEVAATSSRCIYTNLCLEILVNFDEQVMSISATSDFIEDCLNAATGQGVGR